MGAETSPVPNRRVPSVLFINRVYPPDDMASGQMLAHLAEGLAREGWRVTVLTSRTRPGTPGWEVLNGVGVARVAGVAFSRSSHWRRALAYGSLYPVFGWKALRLPRHDCVVTMTDPPLQLLLAPFIRWIKRTRAVHWAQDLYPELAVELGVLKKEGWASRLLTRISTFALRRHDTVAAVGSCMARRVRARGVPEERVRVIPNWAPFSVAETVPAEAVAFRRAHGWAEDEFVLMYSGNFGLAHPFEAILDAAAGLLARRARFRFVFAGNGPRETWLREQTAARGLENVFFLPRQPLDQLPVMLAAADAHVATMENNLNGLVVPSKVYGILAVGRPCLFIGPADCEAADLVRRTGAGAVVEEENGEDLARILSGWRDQADQFAVIRERARKAAREVGLEPALRAFINVLADSPVGGR